DDLALIEWIEVIDQPQERALSGSTGAHDRDDLTPTYRHIDPAEHLARPIGLADVVAHDEGRVTVAVRRARDGVRHDHRSGSERMSRVHEPEVDGVVIRDAALRGGRRKCCRSPSDA